MKKKGAIDLSINLIVVVIISLVILASGIVLLYNLISGAEDIKSTLDSKTEGELERLLTDQGKKVVLPQYTATIEAGKTKVFGLGILNIDEAYYGSSFKVGIKLNKAVDASDTALTGVDTTKWIMYDSGTQTIKENQNAKIPILATIPTTAKKGTYIFDVEVKDSSGNTYDTIKKLVIIVK